MNIKFLLLISILTVCACHKYDVNTEDEIDVDSADVNTEDEIDVDSAEYQAGVKIALKKAEQLTGIVWTPVSRIPKTRPEGSFFEPGKAYKGTPYSSVKELDKFIGQDVSFHTFLSAVSNPHSVLYTEFVNQEPYNGINCAPYYGTVCSMSVNYALGIEAPFPSRSYANASFMKIITSDSNEIERIRICDVLASNGHTIMVVGYEKDASGGISRIKFLENGYYIEFNREELREYWTAGKYVLYRYRDMANNTTINDIEPVDPNPAVCVERGDKCIYREGEPIVLNILDESYSDIELIKEGHTDQVIEKRKIVSQDEEYNNLTEGIYRARLINDSEQHSAYVYFEVRRLQLSITKEREIINVSFVGNSIPATSLELCDISGDHLFTYLVTEDDRKKGNLKIPMLSTETPYFCKMKFQGTYGKIATAYYPI